MVLKGFLNPDGKVLTLFSGQSSYFLVQMAVCRQVRNVYCHVSHFRFDVFFSLDLEK